MKKTVLIVDDSLIDQEVLAAIVAKLGYASVVRNDGFDALQYLGMHAEEVSAILLDIYMSGIDGISMMGHLGKKHPNIPVIVISGSEDPADMNAVTKLGAVGYIQKPMPLAEAEKTLRDLLDKVT